MSGLAVQVRGLSAFSAALRVVDKDLAAELRTVNKKLADEVAGRARAKAMAYGPLQRAAASAIKGSATRYGARLTVRGTKAAPMALPAFWGAEKRTGWYAKVKPGRGRPQFPRWVGADWEYGVHGQGPYAINDALAETEPAVFRAYEQALDRVFAKAFPE